METNVRIRVREVMEMYSLNPNSMAKKLNTSDTNVRNYITDRDAPHEFLLKIIQTFVEISPEWLFVGIGNRKREKYQRKYIEQEIEDIKSELAEIKAGIKNHLTMRLTDKVNIQKEIKTDKK